MGIVNYAHNVVQALQDIKVKPKEQTVKEVGFSLVYPPLCMLQRMRFGNSTSEEEAHIRGFYYDLFPEQYNLGDLLSDLKEAIEAGGRRVLNEARYLIPTGAERREIGERARMYRGRSPHTMGMMAFSSLEEACASRGNYLAREELHRAFGGRFVMPEQK